MQMTAMERDLLLKIYDMRRVSVTDELEVLGEVEVLERTLSGSGFLTVLARHACLIVAIGEEEHVWHGLGALLNKERIDVGFLVYVKDGYIDAIEGYTNGYYGWPDHVDYYEITGDSLIDPADI